jgi:hypothetical protein
MVLLPQSHTEHRPGIAHLLASPADLLGWQRPAHDVAQAHSQTLWKSFPLLPRADGQMQTPELQQ